MGGSQPPIFISVIRDGDIEKALEYLEKEK